MSTVTFDQFNAYLMNKIMCSYLKILFGASVSTKIFGSTVVFNIDNNSKCFLSSKSAS